MESHRANCSKLGMSDRVELVRYAIRRGLTEPDFQGAGDGVDGAPDGRGLLEFLHVPRVALALVISWPAVHGGPRRGAPARDDDVAADAASSCRGLGGRHPACPDSARDFSLRDQDGRPASLAATAGARES